MRDQSEDTERLIAGGTLAGLLAGLAAGAFAGGLGALFFSHAIDKLDNDKVATGALFFTLGLVLAITAVDCAYSGVAAWLARRAGRPLRVRDGLAGDQRVMAALERGELWATLLTVAWGLILVTEGVVVPVARFTFRDLVEAVVLGGCGALFIWYGVDQRRTRTRRR
jgi:hypothetical protein